MLYSDKKQVITIKRAIFPTKENKEFVFSNSNYSRFVWNRFIDQVKDRNIFELDYSIIDDVKKDFYYSYEVPNQVYSKYSIGISEQVAKNMKSAIRTMRLEYKRLGKMGTMRYHSFDPFRCSFKVHAKSTNTSETAFNSRVKLLTPNELSFRVRAKNNLVFELKEDLYTEVKIDHKSKNHTYYDLKRGYKFSCKDIKEIAFTHDCGRLYILLVISVTYAIQPHDLEKNGLIGIDLGIRNPCMTYDGTNFYSFKMDEKVLLKLKHLEERIGKLSRHMDKKYQINKKRFENGEIPSIYTNNYSKLRYKFRITWRRICNIKRNWRNKLAKMLTSKYKYLVVDPIYLEKTLKTIKESKPAKARKAISKAVTFYELYKFNRSLVRQSEKRLSRYIYMKDFETTNRCSRCGEVNDKRMTLASRIFKCEECGYTCDRDMNAAVNLYRIGLSFRGL